MFFQDFSKKKAQIGSGNGKLFTADRYSIENHTNPANSQAKSYWLMNIRSTANRDLIIPRFFWKYWPYTNNWVKRNPLPTPQELFKNPRARATASVQKTAVQTGNIQRPKLIVSVDITILQRLFTHASGSEREIKQQATSDSSFSSPEYSPRLSINYSGSEIETEDEATHEPEAVPVNFEQSTPRVDGYWSDSGISNNGNTFISQLNQRIEKSRNRIQGRNTATNLFPEFPETDREIGTQSPPYERLENLSDFEILYSFLSEDERRIQTKEKNKEPQRQKKRLLRIARSAIIRICPSCTEHRQTKPMQFCQKHRRRSQFRKASKRRPKTQLEAPMHCKHRRQIHLQQ